MTETIKYDMMCRISIMIAAELPVTFRPEGQKRPRSFPLKEEPHGKEDERRRYGDAVQPAGD